MVSLSSKHKQLELVTPRQGHQASLTAFFMEFGRSTAAQQFHPHPFSAEAARERCSYFGADVYCLVTEGNDILGYGMLRGWDEGYDVPSLGIAVAEQARGLGLGQMIMHYLHAEARRRGAKRIRLKVYPGNSPALSLYRNLGYEFGSELEGGQLVGIKVLSAQGARSGC